MKIRMLRNSVAGKTDVFKGKTYDLDDKIALQLVRSGKATKADDKESKAGK